MGVKSPTIGRAEHVDRENRGERRGGEEVESGAIGGEVAQLAEPVRKLRPSTDSMCAEVRTRTLASGLRKDSKRAPSSRRTFPTRSRRGRLSPGTAEAATGAVAAGVPRQRRGPQRGRPSSRRVNARVHARVHVRGSEVAEDPGRPRVVGRREEDADRPVPGTRNPSARPRPRSSSRRPKEVRRRVWTRTATGDRECGGGSGPPRSLRSKGQSSRARRGAGDPDDDHGAGFAAARRGLAGDLSRRWLAPRWGTAPAGAPPVREIAIASASWGKVDGSGRAERPRARRKRSNCPGLREPGPGPRTSRCPRDRDDSRTDTGRFGVRTERDGRSNGEQDGKRGRRLEGLDEAPSPPRILPGTETGVDLR